MNNKETFIKYLDQLKGNVIALIYSFENEQALGFTHYEFWKSEVISAWLNAAEEIGCKPYILDVRTFMQKASLGTLPHIDFCVNLNAGNNNVDNLCLVPAICSFLGVPCVPCSAKTCAIGEDKIFANQIAINGSLHIPRTVPANEEGGIIKNRSYGSSKGIRLSSTQTTCSADEFCQEFISGTDMTIPVLFNPLSRKLEVLPPVGYRHSYGEKWFLNEEAKISHSHEKILCSLSEDAERSVLSLVDRFDVKTFCRVDTRIKNYNFDIPTKINIKDIYFIEINPTPTINNSINFSLSLLYAENAVPHKQCFNLYKSLTNKATVTGYILTCSLLYFTTKHFQLQD